MMLWIICLLSYWYLFHIFIRSKIIFTHPPPLDLLPPLLIKHHTIIIIKHYNAPTFAAREHHRTVWCSATSFCGYLVFECAYSLASVSQMRNVVQLMCAYVDVCLCAHSVLTTCSMLDVVKYLCLVQSLVRTTLNLILKYRKHDGLTCLCCRVLCVWSCIEIIINAMYVCSCRECRKIAGRTFERRWYGVSVFLYYFILLCARYRTKTRANVNTGRSRNCGDNICCAMIARTKCAAWGFLTPFGHELCGTFMD